jgi:hypothetical protein
MGLSTTIRRFDSAVFVFDSLANQRVDEWALQVLAGVLTARRFGDRFFHPSSLKQ